MAAPERLVDAVRALREGSLTSEALTRGMLARVAATDANVQAWAHLDQEHALRAARACDARRAAGQVDGALAGIGLGVKDIIATADLPTELGSVIYADAQPSADAECVARLRHAGGFVFGKTVTTEFAFMQPGKTRNPWNAAHTPGGSSSGSAAAVALRHCAAALATQTNGSIVRPAAYCGVTGFKPMHGRLPYAGIATFSPTLDTLGVIARAVLDCEYVASVLAAPTGIARAGAELATAPRLGVFAGFPWVAIDVEQQRTLAYAAEMLRRAGARIDDIVFPKAWHDAPRVHRCIMLYEGARELGSLQDRERARMSAKLNAALDEGRAIDDADYADAMRRRGEMIDATREVFADRAAILSPPVPAAAPEDLTQTGDPSCCTLWTLLGAPAIVLPVALSANDMPMGAQLSAPPANDEALLAAARWCEARLPFAGLG